MGHLLAILLAAQLLACVTPPPPRSSDAEALRALEQALVALPGMPEAQARRIAIAALDVTAELHTRYRPQRPPQFGNMAFHLGLRDRALCCHWAKDLLRELSALELEGVALHWGVAHRGRTFREHSAVVVVPEGARFEEGLVLDAWRNAGHLHFARVDRDRYPWKLHPADEVRHRISCSDGS